MSKRGWCNVLYMAQVTPLHTCLRELNKTTHILVCKGLCKIWFVFHFMIEGKQCEEWSVIKDLSLKENWDHKRHCFMTIQANQNKVVLNFK